MKLLYNKNLIKDTLCYPLLFLTICIVSCKKFVELGPQNTSLITESVYKDPTTATAAQLGIYTLMEKQSYQQALNNGLLADELQNYSTTQSGLIEMYTNQMTAVNAPTTWSDAYNYIYRANAVILGLTNNPYIHSNVSNQLIGEAKLVRAFWYFYLTNLYGDVPLILNTDYRENLTIGRTNQTQVYTQIKADLSDAKSLLNSNFVNTTDTVTTSERVRPTKWAASALLARVYLYTRDWSDAVTEATTVINNSGTFSLPSLDSAFLSNNKEAIWQIQIPQPSSYNTTDGRYFILTGNPGTGVGNNATVSTQLLNSFESGDNRKIKWIKSVTTTQGTYYFPYKYKVQTGSTLSEYTMVLRLGEQYLIRAEAQAQLNNTTAAIADLDKIRNRAGLLSYTGATDQASVLTAILNERQVELFTEWGNRWLDLKRTNNVDAVMSVVTPLKGGTWEPATDKLYPIPQSDIGANTNLIQNPNY